MNINKSPALLSAAFLFTLSLTSVSASGQTASAEGRVAGYPPRTREVTRPRIIADARTSRERSGSDETSGKGLSSSAELEKQVFDLINRQRRSRGLKNLKWNTKVADVARGHSREMALYDYFSHTGLDGRLVDKRAMDVGLSNWSSIGENIAYLRGYDDPAQYAVERWMLSPSHRENLLDPRWKETGIGLAITRDGTFYFTQVFMVE